MDRAEADESAERQIRELSRQCGTPLAILREKTVTVPRGWVFFYQSAIYLRSGDPMAMLAGNGPLFISHDGTILQLSSALPWEDQLARE
jgi:Immunity protein 35